MDGTNQRLLPVKLWPKYHPWPSENTLRYYIYHEERFGFSQCIVRVGRRILIDEAKFWEWVRNNGVAVNG